MISKSDALTHDTFHYGNCTRHIGKRGGITENIETWRRSGRTQTWKRDAQRFRLPIKYGLYGHSAITEWEAQNFHTAADCPLNN